MSVSRPLSRIAAALLLLSPLPGAAWAAPKSAGVPSVSELVVRASPSVDELDVNGRWCPKPDPETYPASTPPRVVDSYPKEGATIAPGEVRLRVTFNQPMICAYSVDFDGDDHTCEGAGVWTLPDRRTFTMTCPFVPGRDYRLRFGGRSGGFMGRSGRDAEPYTLKFKTTEGLAFTDRDAGPPASEAVTGYVSCTEFDSPGKPAGCRHIPLRAPEADAMPDTPTPTP